MKAWCDLLDERAASELAAGKTEPTKSPRSQQSIFQGMAYPGAVLAEALLVTQEEAGLLAAAVASASGVASPVVAQGLPWQPMQRETAVFAATPMRLITLPREAYRRIMLQTDGGCLPSLLLQLEGGCFPYSYCKLGVRL